MGNSTDCLGVDNYKDNNKDNVKFQDQNKDRDNYNEKDKNKGKDITRGSRYMQIGRASCIQNPL